MNKNQSKAVVGIIVMLCCAITISSCKKILEIPPNAPNQIVTSKLFSDSSAAVGGVVGIYVSNFSGPTPLNGEITIYPALSADELVTTDGSYQSIINNAVSPGNGNDPGGDTGQIWDAFYGSTIVYQANAAIEGLNKSTTLTTTLKNQLIGECEVIRAISFFNLANLYGAVPLPRTSDYTVNSKLPRLPVDSAFAQAAKDLLDASKRLTATYPSAGRARPNKYTALAYLSKVYLYQGNYAAALSAASQVIGSGTYALTSLDGVFLSGSTEAIWQAVNPTDTPDITYEGNTFAPDPYGDDPEFVLTDSLLNAFESGDKRKTSWVNSYPSSTGATIYYPYKYKNNGGSPTTGTEDYMMIRLAEVYLIRAEAEAQTGDLNGAASDINVIRTRAGLPATLAKSKTDILAAIMRERRIELFCEWGNRWYDLKRTGTINAVLGKEKSSWPSDGHAQIYPIPRDQLGFNPGWKQNPGY
jgi:hypothetical protein